jgi:hypothetical protein
LMVVAYTPSDEWFSHSNVPRTSRGTITTKP